MLEIELAQNEKETETKAVKPATNKQASQGKT